MLKYYQLMKMIYIIQLGRSIVNYYLDWTYYCQPRAVEHTCLLSEKRTEIMTSHGYLKRIESFIIWKECKENYDWNIAIFFTN